MGVPHFFKHRHLSTVDLEFNSNKLNSETIDFLQQTKELDPKRFDKIEKHNKLWIDFRLNSNKPVSSEQIINELVRKQMEENS